MIVCDKEVYIISRSGQVAEVNAFAKECGVLQILIVDAAVVFEDPYDGDIYYHQDLLPIKLHFGSTY